MAKLKKLFVSACLTFFVGIFLLPRSGSAETGTALFPNLLVMDSIEYNKNDLINAFYAVAFGNDIPAKIYLPLLSGEPGNNNLLLDRKGWLPLDMLGGLREGYPWLYPYIFNEGGSPRPFAINKWTGPIKISFGYPNDLKPFSVSLPKKIDAEKLKSWPHIADENGRSLAEYYIFDEEATILPDQLEVNAVQAIEALSRDLKELTKLDVSYLSHPKETLVNYAGIRIIFFDLPSKAISSGDISLPSLYKGLKRTSMLEQWSDWPSTPPFGINFRNTVERSLSAKIAFTPSKNEQVDGYIIANQNNEIKSAYCFIPRNLPQPRFLHLIQECVVRSLGLPDTLFLDTLPKVSNSLLTEWSENSYASGLTDVDRFLIRTLYDDRIKPGMTVDQIINVTE